MESEDQELLPIVIRAIEDNQTYAQKYEVSITLGEVQDNPTVHVDSLRAIQVLSNLLSNACKFAPRGSAVTVEVAITGTVVNVMVTDLGTGIPEEFKDRLFDKFTQADSSDTRASDGTGLGLAISRELVHKMGGTITYTSTGNLTIFTVTLPVVQENSQ